MEDALSTAFHLFKFGKKPEDKSEERRTRYPGTLAPLRAQLHSDNYMSRLDIKDNINPIWERETDVPASKDTEDDVIFSYSYSLQRFITRSISVETLTSFDSDEISQLTVSDVEESDIRGVYLHDIHSTNSSQSVLNERLYPVFIQGIPMYGEDLECVDSSPYSQQFGIILYEWFISEDYGSLTRYSPDPVCIGNKFKLPLEAIGKYVFCRAHRKVETQIKDPEDYSGTYDPHVRSSVRAECVKTKRINDVSTLSSYGPIDISDDMALELLENLTNDSYKVKAVLCFDRELSGNVTYKSAEALNNTIFVNIGSSNSRFSIENIPDNKMKDGAIKKLLELSDNPNAPGETLEFDFKNITVEKSRQSEQEILIGIHKEETRHISFRFQDQLRSTIAFYTLLCLATHKDSSFSSNIWSDSLKKGDLDTVKKVLLDRLSVP